MLRRLRPVLAILACLASPLAAQPVIVAEPVAAATMPADEAFAVPAARRETAAFAAAQLGGPGAGEVSGAAAGSGRFVASPPPARGKGAPPPIPRGIAAFGPFRVLDGSRAALVDATDERSPAAFQAMLARYPGIRTLELIECPGTEEDRANLRLGRMIRARGLATHVPSGGSVRSGAVELYLAGVRRQADPGAEFAVHAWADEDGREPKDYPRDAPQNRAYLVYYREMGMTAAEARAFYDMTNSVPNASALWLDAAQMGVWVRPE